MVITLNSKISANSYVQQNVQKNVNSAKTHAQPIRELNSLAQVNFANIMPYFGVKSVAFAGTVTLQTGKTPVNLLEGIKLDPTDHAGLIDDLKGESAMRVEGRMPWREIDQPMPWMVTSETKLMWVGGLGVIGTDLPDAFNERFQDQPEQMPVITPLYMNDGKDYHASLRQDGDQLYYKGGRTEIPVDEVGRIDVPIYQDGRMVNEEVGILVGNLNGTNYVFLRNDKHFNVEPFEGENEDPTVEKRMGGDGAYVTNKNDIDERERFALLSKATYELAKAVKRGDINDSRIGVPNIIVANDWHAGPISALCRYDAPIQAAHKDGNLYDDPDTAAYLRDMPIVHITHNLAYQGDEKVMPGQEKLLNTLFGEATQTVYDLAESAQPNKEGAESSLLIKGATNFANMGLNNADRVVTVSPNYKTEMLTTDLLSYSFQDLLATRDAAGTQTFVGITNGYDKSKVAPTPGNVSKVNDKFQLSGSNAFEAYDADSLDIKAVNKERAFSLLSDLVNEPNWGDGEPKTTAKLYKPEACMTDFSNVDVENTPFIVSVGRLVNQKGYDILADTIEKSLLNKEDNPDAPLPIVFILGSGTDPSIANRLKAMKDTFIEAGSPMADRIFFFNGFDLQLRDAMTMGGDFFPIPSRFEPCGLTQMEAMPKGCIPVATAVGGLVTTIKDREDGFLTDEFYALRRARTYETDVDGNRILRDGQPVVESSTEAAQQIFPPGQNAQRMEGEGVYEQAYNLNVEAFSNTLNDALDVFYNDPDKTNIKAMQQAAMRKSFTWGKDQGSLDAYIQLFEEGTVPDVESITF